MSRKLCSVNLSELVRKAFLVSALAVSWGPLLRAQEVRILVLNGRNGRPISNECLNIWVPNFYGAHIVAGTNKQGIVMLHITDHTFAGGVGCAGWAVSAIRPKNAEAITISGDKYVACQEYGKVLPQDGANRGLLKQLMPSYSISRIAHSGLSSSNTCGKFREQAKPGELIFYVRPRSFFEKMRQ